MAKKMKLNLEDLEVQSFVTSSPDKKEKIKGGKEYTVPVTLCPYDDGCTNLSTEPPC